MSSKTIFSAPRRSKRQAGGATSIPPAKSPIASAKTQIARSASGRQFLEVLEGIGECLTIWGPHRQVAADASAKRAHGQKRAMLGVGPFVDVEPWLRMVAEPVAIAAAAAERGEDVPSEAWYILTAIAFMVGRACGEVDSLDVHSRARRAAGSLRGRQAHPEVDRLAQLETRSKVDVLALAELLGVSFETAQSKVKRRRKDLGIAGTK